LSEKKYLNIISFDIPYPPNYGGVIDVYYKILELKNSGIEVILHTFMYGKSTSVELENICKKVYYYKRIKPINPFGFRIPYIVKSRKSINLLNNLKNNDFPILFEGLHTCYYLKNKYLTNRIKIVRMHNIEHDYYYNLYLIEKNILKKIYFATESKLLKSYQKMLKYSDSIAVISSNDFDYLKTLFNKKVFYLPVFHGNTEIKSKLGKGTFAFYHGKLSVGENNEAAMFLIKEVFKYIDYKLIIAGLNPSESLIQEAKKYKNVEVIANPSFEKMEELIQNAHIHVLPTFQATGIKLKLLNSLYNGRFVVANKFMTENTGVENLCYHADSAEEMIGKIIFYSEKNFTEEEIIFRQNILNVNFNQTKNIQLLIKKAFIQ